ncbi:MAG: DUF1425 domain-containing protein [Opitutales bacterium]|nr:DUF1425 domain-containing protein [Opitutales bacterium]
MKNSVVTPFRAIALLASLLLVVSACQTPHITVPSEPGDVAVLPMRAGSVEVEGILNPDGSVNPTSGRGVTVPGQSFYVSNVVSAREEEGYPRVQVSLTSRSSSDVNLRYRVIWFDEDEMEISGGSGWTPVLLSPRETIQLSSVGRSTAAKQFRVFIQELSYRR